MCPKPSRIGDPEEEEEELEEEEEKQEEKEEEEEEEKSHQQRTDTNVSHIWIWLNIVSDLKNWKRSKKKTQWINVYLLISWNVHFMAYFKRTKSKSIPEKRTISGFGKHPRQCCSSRFLKSKTIDILAGLFFAVEGLSGALRDV